MPSVNRVTANQRAASITMLKTYLNPAVPGFCGPWAGCANSAYASQAPCGESLHILVAAMGHPYRAWKSGCRGTEDRSERDRVEDLSTMVTTTTTTTFAQDMLCP